MILESWLGTRYIQGQCKKGVAVDCLHFVCAAINEVSGDDYDPGRLGTNPSSDRYTELLNNAVAHYRAVPCDDVVDAGDIVIINIRARMHAMIVGNGDLWHASSLANRVCTTNLNAYSNRINSIWRPDKSGWHG